MKWLTQCELPKRRSLNTESPRYVSRPSVSIVYRGCMQLQHVYRVAWSHISGQIARKAQNSLP